MKKKWLVLTHLQRTMISLNSSPQETHKGPWFWPQPLAQCQSHLPIPCSQGCPVFLACHIGSCAPLGLCLRLSFKCGGKCDEMRIPVVTIIITWHMTYINASIASCTTIYAQGRCVLDGTNHGFLKIPPKIHWFCCCLCRLTIYTQQHIGQVLRRRQLAA